VPSDESWHDYPDDVPLAKRAPCSSPGCDQPSVVVRATTWVPTLTSPGPNFFPETRLRPYCKEHAMALGWSGGTTPAPPAHLNAFQRWVVRLLDHGDNANATG